MKTRGAAALSLLLLAPTLWAQEEAKDPLETRITFALTGTLKEHLELLSQKTGVRMEVETGDLPEALRKVELTLNDVKGITALKWIADLHGCGFIRRSGRVRVSPDLRGYRGDPVLRTYAADGLMVRSSWIVPPRLGLGRELQPALQVVKEEPKPVDPDGEKVIVDTFEETLLDLIKENVAPGTWEGICTIDRDPTRNLVVNQTAEAHRELEWFLGALRAFPRTSVAVTLEIADGIGDLADLWAPGASGVLSREAAESVAKRIRAANGRSLQASGLAGESFHALLTEESAGVSGFLRGSPVVGKWLSDARLIEVRPAIVGRDRSVHLDLRLSLGHTRSFDPVKTRPGLLPLHERELSVLGTSFIVPAGGGVLLLLPSRNPADPRPQVALLRASPGKEPDEPTPPFLMSPLPTETADPILEKLKVIPDRELDLKDAPIAEFAAWLRDAAHVNVVVDPELAETTLTLRLFQKVSVSNVLTLALQPRDLSYFVADEAVYLRPRICFRGRIQTCILGARDVIVGGSDFPARPERESQGVAACNFEDLANIIKNSVHKDAWEEADGKSIQAQDGLLLLRNHANVLKDCIAFVEQRRAAAPRLLSVRAETLVVPSRTVDEILGAGGEGPASLDGARLKRLEEAGTVLERLAWMCIDQQKTSVTWDRSRDYLHSFDGEDPILRADVSPSYLELCPMIEKVGKVGKVVRVDLRYEDRRLIGLKDAKVNDDVTIQVPSGQTVTAKTSFQLPVDRSVVFRWSAPSKDGEPSRCRLLVLSVTPAEKN